MKTRRLLGYAVLGIIGGLLIENKGLCLGQMAAGKVRKLRHKAARKIADAADALISAATT